MTAPLDPESWMVELTRLTDRLAAMAYRNGADPSPAKDDREHADRQAIISHARTLMEAYRGAEEDARRLDWLEAQSRYTAGVFGCLHELSLRIELDHTAASFRAAIDAARAPKDTK